MGLPGRVVSPLLFHSAHSIFRVHQPCRMDPVSLPALQHLFINVFIAPEKRPHASGPKVTSHCGFGFRKGGQNARETLTRP